MDYDGDTDLDILSGSYTGEIYLFERVESGGFAQGRYLLATDGEPLDTGTSVTPEAVDMDGDADLDLVIGTRTDGVFVVENTGTRSEPAWSPEPEQVLTVEGERVKGSNAHHADWDGDGLDDLIVGSEWGGASWYRNIGEEDTPAYASAETLVERREYEERSELDGPSGPGSRTKVHVTDWNRDGQPDLLMGDVQWLYETLPPLTAEQEAEKQALTPAYEAALELYGEVIDERNASVRAGDEIPDDVKARMDAAQEALAPLSNKMSAFDRQKAHTHGWVWLYLRGGEHEVVADRGSQMFGPATFEVVARAVRGDDARLHLESTLRLDTGWRVYADVPEGSPYQATRLSLTSADGAELASTWETATSTSPDPKGVDRSCYMQTVTFTCDVRLPDNADDEIAVSIHFQACDDQICLPPKTLTVKLGATMED